MTWYDLRGGGTDNPMLWVHAGPNTHAMGMHITQGVWDYIREHGLDGVTYSRKVMQPKIEAIQKIVDALPKPPRTPGDPLQVGDLVQVGRGKVPWTVTSVSKVHEMVGLSSTKSVIGRSELASNLTRLPDPAPPVAVKQVATAVTKAMSRRPVAVSGATVGLGVGLGLGVAAVGAGVALAVRDHRRRHITGAVTAPVKGGPGLADESTAGDGADA